MYVFWVVYKVDDKDFIFIGCCLVEMGEGLYNFYMVSDFFVYIYGDQFGLIKVSLEFVSY